DVDGGHMGRAVLQQTFGEAAGRGADVDAAGAREYPSGGLQGRFDLLGAAADEAGVGAANLQPRQVVVGDRVGGLGDAPVTDPDLAGADEPLGLIARLDESEVDQREVGAFAATHAILPAVQRARVPKRSPCGAGRAAAAASAAANSA